MAPARALEDRIRGAKKRLFKKYCMPRQMSRQDSFCVPKKSISMNRRKGKFVKPEPHENTKNENENAKKKNM